MALGADAVRRLSVIATETGLTTVTQKLQAMSRSQDDVAASSVRMQRATELAQARINALASGGNRLLSNATGSFVGAAGAETLAAIGRIAPAAIAAYGAFKVLNATIEQGISLLEKYGIAGQRELFGKGVDEAIEKITKLQQDTVTLQQARYAGELSDRLDQAKFKISEFLKIQFDLTDPALKLMNAWVVIAEKIAAAASAAQNLPSSAMLNSFDILLRSIPGVGQIYSAGKLAVNAMSPEKTTEPGIDENMAAARARLAAGLGGGVSRIYQAFLDLANPPKPEPKETRDAWDRALDSVSRNIALMKADADAVDLTAGAHARLRVEAQLLEAGMRSGLSEATVRSSKEFSELSARAEGAANALARARLVSDINFERSQIGRTDTEAAIASRLRSAGLPIDLNSTEAGLIRINEQLKTSKELVTDFATGFSHDFVNGIRQGENAWQSFRDAGLNALNRLSDKLMDMALSNLVAKAFGGTGFNIFSLFGFGGGGGSGLYATQNAAAVKFHSGGVVGRDGTPAFIHPAYFENAPRYHSGGIAGLAPDEVPAILQRGERVIPRDAQSGGISINVPISVGGETNNADIANMVGRAVQNALDDYDRKRLPTRVAAINADPRVR